MVFVDEFVVVSLLYGIPIKVSFNAIALTVIPLEGGRSRVQLMMVGRPHLTDVITEAFEEEVPTIHVTSTKNSEDIVHYIQSSIRKSTILKRAPRELQIEIVEKLSKNAQGMFLWVSLMLKELAKKRSPTTLRKSLNEAPRGISEMFRHVLESFSSSMTDEDSGYLNELLAWTTCAQSPLKLSELDAVLKLMSDEGEGIFYLEGILRGQYASFFSLIREDGLSTADLQIFRGIPVNSDSDQEVEEEGFDDAENATDFHSSPSTTQVTLCHGSIRDFFRDEAQGKVSAGDGYPMIGVNFNEAKTSVLKTCLNLFCDEKLVEKTKGSPSLLSYAAKNWQHYLRTVDPSKTSWADRREIAGLLANMFKLERSMKTWAGEVTWKFFDEDNVKVVRTWLDYEDIRDDLPSEDKGWIESTSEIPADTFLALARYVAQRWLQDVMWIPNNCCWIIYAFINLRKGIPLVASASAPDTADEILSVAEWADFEKTALWHRRIAMVFREHAMYDDALTHFTKALQMDDTMWLARGGMALLYASKAEYIEAIRLDKITEDTLQNIIVTEPHRSLGIKPGLHVVQERLSQCHYRLGDNEAALEYRRRAFVNNNRCGGCISACLAFLAGKERHQDIIDMLKSMKDEIPGRGYSRLTESLWQHQFDDSSFTAEAALASLKTNELPFLIDEYRSAITAAKKEFNVVTASLLELCLAQVYYVYGQDEEKAVRIWEKISKTFAGLKVETEMGYAKDRALACLARHWFKMASEAEKASLLTQIYVGKLESLAKFNVQTTGQSSTFISTNAPSIILGVWYRLNDRPEDARACFREHVREALQILSENDPENDYDGYLNLGLVFLASGDDKNAVAMFQILGDWGKILQGPDDTIEDQNEVPDLSDSDPDKDSGDCCTCDGPCNRSFSNYYGIALCRYCHDVAFCEPCLKLLKEDDLQTNVCNPKHDWLVIPPLEKTVGAGELLVAGEAVAVEDWKKNLKQRWQV
jgi:tetratricopeptide (TPR) repeat protein